MPPIETAPPGGPSTELLRSILDTANDAFVAIDPRGVITDWNRQAEVTFGWSREEAIGRTLSAILIPERYRAAHDAGMRRLLDTGESRVLNRVLRLDALRRDGSELPIELTIWEVDSESHRFCAFLRDVTEAVRSERTLELLRRLAFAANEAGSADDAFAQAIEVVSAYAGWSVGHVWRVEAGVLRPAGIWYLRQPGAFAGFRAATDRTLLRAGEGLPGEVLATGTPVWVEDVTRHPNFPRVREIDALPVRAALGFPVLAGAEVAAVLEFFSERPAPRDPRILDVMAQVGALLGRVVERERLATERVWTRELERSNRDLEMFAYVASHDLQEPLRAITGYLQVLERRHGHCLQDDGRHLLEQAVGGATRMHGMVRGLLDYARVETTGKTLAPTDAERVLAEALANLEAAIREAGAKVEHDPLPWVLADDVQLLQVFQNLLSNAIKFRSEAPPCVEVRVAPRAGEWHVCVIDNGVGIPPEHAERIFEVFQRLPGAARVEGTGMGLAVVRRIVERHGGRVWVDTSRARGAAVCLALRAAAPAL